MSDRLVSVRGWCEWEVGMSGSFGMNGRLV